MQNIDREVIGRALKKQRTQLQVDVNEIARRLRMSRGHVYYIERGLADLRPGKLKNVLSAYELTEEQLTELRKNSVDPAETDSANKQVIVSVADLEFLLDVARGLQTPMNLDLIRELLQRRKEP